MKLKKHFRIRPPSLTTVSLVLSFSAILAILPFYYIQFYQKKSTQVEFLKPLREKPLYSITEKKKLDEALKFILIRSYGMYTLLGSKPITTFNILRDVPYNRSDEQLQQDYDVLVKKYEGFKDKVSIEEYKNSTSNESPFDEEAIWNFWKENWKKYTGKKYLFFEKKDILEIDGKKQEVGEGFFVNVFEAACIIKKHYQEFRDELGEDFDPLQAIYNLPNPSSILWRHNSEYLYGLLLGFGEKNSYLFKLRNKGKIPFKSVFLFDAQEESNHLSKSNVSIDDLPLPAFVTFSFTDEQLFIYKKEREKILDFYHNKDFLETTMEYLKGDLLY